MNFVNIFYKNNTLRNGNNQYNRNDSTLCLMLFCFLNAIDVFQTKKNKIIQIAAIYHKLTGRERESPLKTFAFSAFFHNNLVHTLSCNTRTKRTGEEGENV